MIRAAGSAFALATLAAVPAVAQTAGFTGSWVSSPDRFEVLSSEVRESPRGWSGVLEAVAATGSYRIEIRDEGERVSVSFPGGDKNFLTGPPFVLDGVTHTRVEDRSGWWEKFVTSAARENGQLVLAATRLNGWWSVDPATVESQPTQLETRFRVALDPSGDALTLTVGVADEKGRAEYRQRFVRVSPAP